jgi:Ni,Fe-hydrogenase I cytochrome b subunit
MADSTFRHSAMVRVTHWLTTVCLFALLVSGIEIVISHPRFYWGEDGNVLTPALFTLPIPASRGSVPTGYNYVLPGIFYVAAGAAARHFRFRSYNPIQRGTYLFVVFVLFPLAVWTGLAMSPAVVSAFPFVVTVFGGQQSARTIHFFVTVLFVLFVLIHVVMVWRAGFIKLTRAMITGRL